MLAAQQPRCANVAGRRSPRHDHSVIDQAGCPHRFAAPALRRPSSLLLDTPR